MASSSSAAPPLPPRPDFKGPESSGEPQTAYSQDLCQRCRDLDMSGLSDPSFGAITGHIGPTLAETRLNRTKCGICAMVDGVLSKTDLSSELNDRNVVLLKVDARARYTFSVGDRSFEEAEEDRQYPPGGTTKQLLGLSIHLHTGGVEGKKYHHPGMTLEAYVPYDADEWVRQKLPFRETLLGDLEGQVAIARRWLNWCVSRHWRCRKTLAGADLDEAKLEPELPTRILQIQPDGLIRLIETKGGRGKYAALSYCWSKVVLETTRDVYKSFQTAVPVEKAPRAIRKALTLTQKLGIEYLWVDALCIIQHDREDWDREAKKMADVYSQAYVTIAMLEQDDETMDEDWPAHPPCSDPKLSWVHEGEHLCDVSFNVASIDERESRLKLEKQKSRWGHRAWTCQEEILARRVLYVGQEQFFWECQEEQFSEDGRDNICSWLDDEQFGNGNKNMLFRTLGYEDDVLSWMWDSNEGMPLERIKDRKLKIVYGAVKKPMQPGSGFRKVARAVERFGRRHLAYEIGEMNWDQLLRGYTARDLTKLPDKFVAFEGLASAIAARTEQVHHAGIWTNSIAKGLFWCAAHSPLQRISPAQVPSWSWAGWHGVIRWHYRSVTLKDTDHPFNKGFAGDLSRVKFELNNEEVDQIPGARPVSLSASGRVYHGLRSLPISNDEDRVWNLHAGFVFWNPTLEPWGLENIHLLCLEGKDSLWKKVSAIVTNGYKCVHCSDNLDGIPEGQAVAHAESCSGGSRRRAMDAGSGLGDVVGLAVFDTPDQVPPSFEAIVLWHERGDFPRNESEYWLRDPHDQFQGNFDPNDSSSEEHDHGDSDAEDSESDWHDPDYLRDSVMKQMEGLMNPDGRKGPHWRKLYYYSWSPRKNARRIDGSALELPTR